MKKILILTILLTTCMFGEDLKIKSKLFNTDQKIGISTFEENVNIIKGTDELNASKVIVYTDENQQPIKFVAEGDASFSITTVEGDRYKGTSQKVVYYPVKKEYHFFIDVHLKQINEKKEISGDEVILKTIEGKAYAKGAREEPVIMIFDMPEKTDKK